MGWDGFSTSLLIWVRNWHDVWCGDRPLKDEFLEFYLIAAEKDASVQSLYVLRGIIQPCARISDSLGIFMIGS